MSIVRRKNASKTFSKERILKNFTIHHGEDYTTAVLKNSQAYISLLIPDSINVDAELRSFEIPPGAIDSDGKCALYALLLELVEKKVIDVNRIVHASEELFEKFYIENWSITPDRPALRFGFLPKRPGLPDMEATVNDLIVFLGRECTMMSYKRDANNEISERSKALLKTSHLRQLAERNRQRSNQNKKKLEKKANRATKFFSFRRKKKLHEEIRF